MSFTDSGYNKSSLACNFVLTVKGAWTVVKNNVEIDIKVMCIEAGTTQAKLAQAIGTTPAYVNRVI